MNQLKVAHFHKLAATFIIKKKKKKKNPNFTLQKPKNYALLKKIKKQLKVYQFYKIASTLKKKKKKKKKNTVFRAAKPQTLPHLRKMRETVPCSFDRLPPVVCSVSMNMMSSYCLLIFPG